VKIYPLALAEDSPMAFRANQWPSTLLVYSDKVRAKLAEMPDKNSIPLETVITTDYGCTKAIRLVSVAGVNVESDASANWFWRDDKSVTEKTGPGSEDQWFFWCRIKFYRGQMLDKK
jgi:hypothetical protein